MIGRIASWRALESRIAGVRGSTAAARGTPDSAQDKRPGTAARQAVVQWASLPCRRDDRRAGVSGKPLIERTFCGAGTARAGSQR